jgi:hypothetical protein
MAQLLFPYATAIILIRVLGAAKCEGGSTPFARLYATTMSKVVVLTNTLHLLGGGGLRGHIGAKVRHICSV